MPRRPCPSSQERRATPNAGNACEKLTQLYLLYLSDSTNEELRGEFATSCMKALRKEIGYHVYRRGICPRFLAPSTFAEDAFSLALVKFWGGIRTVRKPKKLSPWLSSVARSAVVEELRNTIRRRKDGPCTWEGLETVDGGGAVVNVLDDEGNRQAAEHRDALTFTSAPDSKHLIHQDILHKLLRDNGNGSKRQREGSHLLALILTLHLTVDEIAARRGTTKTDVRHLLSASRKNMRHIAESRYNFTAKDL